MKTILSMMLACGLVSSASAQGQIAFSAAQGNLIQYKYDVLPAVPLSPGNPAMVNGRRFNLALYGAPVGTPLPGVGASGVPDLSGAWKVQTSPILQQIGPNAGQIAPTIVQMPASALDAGGNLQLIVVGWTGDHPDFMSAVAAMDPQSLLAWTGDWLIGGARTWVSGSGTATTPYIIGKGPNAFNGLVFFEWPEPSTGALAGLGVVCGWCSVGGGTAPPKRPRRITLYV